MKAIVDFITCIIIHLQFIYKTKIYPKHTKHYWCKFHYWLTDTEKEGWYVLDKRGDMIPWVHFDQSSLICLYPHMIVSIEDKERK